MSAPRHRRRVIRKLAQAARDRSKKPAPPPAVEPIVEDDVDAGASTVLGTRVPPPVDPHSSTVALPAMGPSRARDPGAETEAADGGPSASSVAPDPPDRLRFVCPCGAPMTATRDTYDGRMKCDGCGSVLLVALLYDPKLRAWRIEALRTKL